MVQRFIFNNIGTETVAHGLKMVKAHLLCDLGLGSLRNTVDLWCRFSL